MARITLATAAMMVLSSQAAAPTGAQQPAVTVEATSEIIAATVAGEPIYTSEIARLSGNFILQSKPTGRELAAQERAMVEADILARLIEQRLVELYLAEKDVSVAPDEVEGWTERVKTQLAASNPSLSEMLDKGDASKESLRHQVTWRLSWQKCLAAQLTDDRLEKYFDDHRGDFDGTQVDARHILLMPANAPAGSDVAARSSRAEQIRQEIVDGKISFADAAKKYSQGPSGRDGGDLGFLPRRAVMSEAFSAAAFALETGQISQPVTSPSGVHLIQVKERVPGSRKWSESREELRDAAAAEMRRTVVNEQLKTVPIKFTGHMPHFKPGTRELVMPKNGGE